LRILFALLKAIRCSDSFVSTTTVRVSTSENWRHGGFII
jgi:hypothetical protein